MKNYFYKKSFVFAAIAYVVIFIVLFGSLNFKNHLHAEALPNPSPKIIDATTVNQQQVQQQINKIKAERQAKNRAEIARQQRLVELAERAKQQRIIEQKRLVELAARAKQQRIVEQKRLDQLRQQQARLKEQQEQLERSKKRNLATQTEVETQLQQEIAGKQQQIQKEIADRQQQIIAAQAKQESTEIDKYKSLIVNVIEQNWIIPSKIDRNLSAQLLIDLAPGGTVLGVEILKSSGNAALDSSAVTAVWKASPLPVPSAISIFNQMRKLHLTVRPEGYI